MKIVLRSEAKALGLTRYFTGKKCKQGHISMRRTHNGECCECASIYSKIYESKNRDWRVAKARERARKNTAKRVLYNKEWRHKNPEIAGPMARAGSLKRRARKRSAEGRHSAQDIKKLLAKQNHKCAACRVSVKMAGYHVDHIIPLARGGANWPDNLQILCPTCNLSKGAKDPIAWANECGRLL